MLPCREPAWMGLNKLGFSSMPYLISVVNGPLVHPFSCCLFQCVCMDGTFCSFKSKLSDLRFWLFWIWVRDSRHRERGGGLRCFCRVRAHVFHFYPASLLSPCWLLINSFSWNRIHYAFLFFSFFPFFFFSYVDYETIRLICIHHINIRMVQICVGITFF